MNELKKIIDTISKNIDIVNNTSFPNKDEFKNNYAEINLKILIEQSNLLFENKIVSTVSISEIDYKNLEKLFLEDIKTFLTKHYKELNIDLKVFTIAQSILPPNTLNHILNSRVFKDSYKTVDLLDQDKIYDLYSLPFLIRITIETQIKSIIGFDSIQKSTLLISKIIEFLIIYNNLVSINKTILEDIKNIYAWSSSFIHTGEKEPIWLILKSLQLIQKLFVHQETQSQDRREYLDYLTLNYLTIELQEFQDKLNTFLYPRNNNRIILSSKNFEIPNEFYDNTKNIWI